MTKEDKIKRIEVLRKAIFEENENGNYGDEVVNMILECTNLTCEVVLE